MNMRPPAAPVLLLAALLSALPALPAGAAGAEEAPHLDGLVFERQVGFSFAEGIDVYCYEGGWRYYDVHGEEQYLQVPEGKEAPAGLDKAVTLLPDSPRRIYLAATGSMALFNAISGLDRIRLSSLRAQDWYVESARQAMEDGSILFAGKYSAPDFELLLREDCDLAVESTMILHTPKIREMLETLGIPVFIDRSGYESHPLGRTEWVKVYGVMTGAEEEAEAFFEEQARVLEEMTGEEDTGKSAAFFYISSDGSVVVRRSSDTVPGMIRLAGGTYALDGMEDAEESHRSSLPVSMEEFYLYAADADYLVYNASIEPPLESVEELLEKNPLFSEFRAVQEDNVWCTDRYLYQATDLTGSLIRDFHAMMTGGDESEMVFLRHVDSD